MLRKGLEKVETNLNNVIEVVSSIKIGRRQLTDEKNVEKIIAQALEAVFPLVARQYNIGGYLGLKTDIDVGNGKVGLEIKLVKALESAATIQRLFGQAIYYHKRVYTGRLLIVVVGSEAQEKQPFLSEMREFIEEIGVKYLYLRAV